MTTLMSEKVSLDKNANEVFTWLCNLNNYKMIMPQQVEDWVSTETDCSFTIKGMASLGMELKEAIPSSQVFLIKKGKAPFDFTLVSNIVDTGDGKSTLQLHMDADLNPFLKMMAEKPLTNFLNMLVNKYKEISTTLI